MTELLATGRCASKLPNHYRFWHRTNRRKDRTNVTHKSFIIAIVLVGLTLGSFALVSSYLSKRPNRAAVPATAPAARPASTTVAPVTANRQAASDKQMYQDLGQSLTLLEQLRSTVLTGDWDGAQNLFDEFARKTQQLPAPQLNQPDISPILQDFFTLHRVELGQALNERHTTNARFALNQLQAIVNEQRLRLGTRGMPLEFNRLAFLAREIELWAQLDNKELLQERVKALHSAWQELRPLMAARRNGRETANHFDQLVEQLTADVAPDYSALSNACLKDLEQLEALFQHAPNRPANPTVSPSKHADD